ncbi:homogentisate 1,2-dioxygenase [bacterium]|nr:homogentisate 1,2-dioxygenase [bacterium]NBW97931.1 homogentisate 1,2-dioxygenase [bacterium]NBX82602.1 homogentisate 1,2-dioxygenase [bacterium]
MLRFSLSILDDKLKLAAQTVPPVKQELTYQSGFGNLFESEALSGALPKDRNSPKAPPFGLYAEQLSGSAFTVPRHENRRTWFYRIRPSVVHGPLQPSMIAGWKTLPEQLKPAPQQLRWDPLPKPTEPIDFFRSFFTLVCNGSPQSRQGVAVHSYSASQSMEGTFASVADGELLIVPEKGTLLVRTECGDLQVEPSEVVCIPRGMKFQVKIEEPWVRGYVCENFGEPFRLPTLGLIGANGLADARHFLAPTARFEDQKGQFQWLLRYQGHVYQSQLDRSPLDVVAWHGNYVPYKYDLRLFQPVNTVRVDHPDPSIFTVLTSPSALSGLANCDFVIFPPRWMVAQDTFRPPYYHRNIMSEWMGLVHGQYDAKQKGFIPGGSSLHNCMAPHGPDAETVQKALASANTPQFLDNTLAIMFESCYPYSVPDEALKSSLVQKDYLACWKNIEVTFRQTP